MFKYVLRQKTPRLFYVAVCNNLTIHKITIQNTLLLILAMMSGIVKYSEMVSTIGLVTMAHTFYFIV